MVIDRCQRTDERGQITEDRGERREERCQMREDRCQRREDRCQRREAREWQEAATLRVGGVAFIFSTIIHPFNPNESSY
jgi:hypothetical protein